MTRYRLVIFDLDGTLLDATEGIMNAVRYTVAECGLPALFDEILRTFIGPPIQDSFCRAYGIEDVGWLRRFTERT